MSGSTLIDIEVPEQGVGLHLEKSDAINFFTAERSWYSKLQPLLSENFVFENRNLGNAGIYQNSISAFDRLISALNRDDVASVGEYIQHARRLRCVVGQGAIGRQIDDLLSTGDSAAAKWIFYIFSAEWIRSDDVNQAVAPFRALIRGNPAFKSGLDLNSAGQALSIANAAEERSVAAGAALEKFIAEKTGLIAELEELYRQKLIIEEPARFWASISGEKAKGWKLWLIVFAALVSLPIGIVLIFWRPIADSIVQVTSTGTGGFSLAGLGVITVPALFYAWLLKNVSRLFVQNLSAADDAAHRRALAITYLGLAENPKLQLAPEDRLLILNALFRPTSPHSGDEGPPATLIELIKSKA